MTDPHLIPADVAMAFACAEDRRALTAYEAGDYEAARAYWQSAQAACQAARRALKAEFGLGRPDGH